MIFFPAHNKNFFSKPRTHFVASSLNCDKLFSVHTKQKFSFQILLKQSYGKVFRESAGV